MTLTYAEFCAGAGGLGLAVEEVFGAELAWYSEFEAAPSRVMAHHWPDAPNHGDMTAIDFAAVEQVDILSGGTPCQDLSHAGRRAGMRTGTRSGLWGSMREAIATIKPTYVVWENVRGAYSAGADSSMEQCPGCLGTDGGDGKHVLRALGRVLGDLSDLGYDCQWRGLRAADVGAPHGRFRVFILATRRGAQPTHTDDTGLERQRDPQGTPPTQRHRHVGPGADRRNPGVGHDGRTRGPNGRFTPLAPNTGSEVGVERAGLCADESGRLGRGRPDDDHSPAPVADTQGFGRIQGRAEHARIERRPHVAERGTSTPADARSDEPKRWGVTGDMGGATPASQGDREERERVREAVSDSGTGIGINWGPYEPAIRRWEAVRGAAPAPTELTPKGKHRLNPRCAEWMMGWPAGWVDLPGVSRNDQLKIIGNGVVPQQAAAALRHMLAVEERKDVAA